MAPLRPTRGPIKNVFWSRQNETEEGEAQARKWIKGRKCGKIPNKTSKMNEGQFSNFSLFLTSKYKWSYYAGPRITNEIKMNIYPFHKIRNTIQISFQHGVLGLGYFLGYFQYPRQASHHSFHFFKVSTQIKKGNI